MALTRLTGLWLKPWAPVSRKGWCVREACYPVLRRVCYLLATMLCLVLILSPLKAVVPSYLSKTVTIRRRPRPRAAGKSIRHIALLQSAQVPIL